MVTHNDNRVSEANVILIFNLIIAERSELFTLLLLLWERGEAKAARIPVNYA